MDNTGASIVFSNISVLRATSLWYALHSCATSQESCQVSMFLSIHNLVYLIYTVQL